MAVSPGEGTSIIVRGDASTTRRTGRIQKPTTKVRVVQQTNTHEEVDELKDKIKELSQLIQDLLKRDADKDKLLENCSKKIEALERELEQEKRRPAQRPNGLEGSMRAIAAPHGQSSTNDNRPPLGRPTYAQELAAAVK